MSRMDEKKSAAPLRVPRASGDEPPLPYTATNVEKCSPRERG